MVTLDDNCHAMSNTVLYISYNCVTVPTCPAASNWQTPPDHISLTGETI